MSNEIKKIRGQVRQIVKELLPEVLSSELIAKIAEEINKKVSERLNLIDSRQKDMNSYIIRSHSSNEPLLKPTK